MRLFENECHMIIPVKRWQRASKLGVITQCTSQRSSLDQKKNKGEQANKDIGSKEKKTMEQEEEENCGSNLVD